jgi:ubiquinone/menaquinone biosynthesis C-methylase UbiE
MQNKTVSEIMSMLNNPYRCPSSKEELRMATSGLVGEHGAYYPFLNVAIANPIPVFIDEALLSEKEKISRAMYKQDNAESTYENFLTWLFETFNEDQMSFRNSLVDRLNLKEGDRVLVTGCGLGDDVKCIVPKVGSTGKVFAQDISDLMIVATARRLSGADGLKVNSNNLYLSVSNASMLPHPDAYFDAAYHFGGINLFSNIKSAIHEMARVVKVGGKVLIGDEGVAPWLKDSEYGKIAICNNKLWAAEPPLSLLPETASNVRLTWVLGNCFYVIDFEVSDSRPLMDIDVPHKGTRGGSMRKRYFGQLEGIDPELKVKVGFAASNAGLSVSAWVEHVIAKALEVSD